MNFFTLNNGVSIPAVGSGTNTFGRDSSDLKAPPTGNFQPLYDAVANGYTFFDCAKSYGNEAGLGETFASLGVERSKLFLLSKIPNKPEFFANEQTVRGCLESTLRDLRTDYLDMYMIHQPISYADQALGKPMDADEIVRVYKILESLYREGKVRSIGVANFTPAQLTVLMERTEIVPAANQFRCNPASRNAETVAFCKEHGILPMAHSPMNFTLKAFTVSDDLAERYRALAGEIGSKYGKSWSQVLLRYDYQLGICTIPKTHTPERQKQNIDIFDFSLTQEEMIRLY